jgi:hypothetical protein
MAQANAHDSSEAGPAEDATCPGSTRNPCTQDRAHVQRDPMPEADVPPEYLLAHPTRLVRTGRQR